MLGKRSFFEKLTGAVKITDSEENAESEQTKLTTNGKTKDWLDENSGDGELTVDVFQTPGEVIIKTMVAGVRPEDLDISITRDMVTIQGKRETERTISEEDYFHRELYWGTFSRTVMLPQEVEIEEAEAVEKHGLLIIKLPKLDKHRQAKLRVKNSA